MTDAGQARPTDALHSVRRGDGSRIVLVHGFTQTHVSWAPVGGLLDADHEVIAVDAPGHGGSERLRAGLTEGAEALGATGGRAVYVGYSMGGRLALRLALDRPDLVTGLVLIGATAGIDDETERAERRRCDEALADRIVAEGVSAFLERWLDQPLFADLEISDADRAARLSNTAEGLASSLRLAGTGTMEPPWWDELHRVEAPTLIVAGDRDPKFTDLGRRLAAGIGAGATFTPIAGAGHAVHHEQPAAVAAAIASLASIGG